MISNDEIQEVLDTSDRLVEATKLDFHRYLPAEIDWRDRLICIKGARGTGKTTLMRQRIKEAFGAGGKAVFSGVGDFLVDGKYHFEVGGPKKGFDQIADLPNSFVVNDGVERGVGNKIPLWLFGFLY